MSSVKIILRTERENGKGEHPLRMRITKNRRTKTFNLGIDVVAEQWDDEKQRVKKSHPNASRINAFLATKVAEAEGVAVELETNSKYIGTYKIKETLMGKSLQDFFPYADKFAEQFFKHGKIGSHRRAKSVIQKLRNYLGEKPFYFDQFTVTFLKEYESHLAEIGNGLNTIHANMRLIRTIINNAVREDLMPIELNPFPKHKLKCEQSQRDFLNEKELHSIEALQLDETYMINHHRNAYIFSAYAGGLRISDLLQLRWRNFDGERITIKIHKTQTPLSILLPNKALEIINFYKREEAKGADFIFPLIRISPEEKNPLVIHNAISSATAYINKNLSKISELADIEKHISFHTSRHTWATRALTKGMRIEHVSKLLGHGAIKETQPYAKIVNAELDKAMVVFN